MFSRVREPTLLELEVNKGIRELKNHPIGSEEYVKALDQIVKLHKMKEEEKPKFVSRDTLVLVAANLLGIMMIIRHEHLNVVTSRALNMVIKPR